MFELKYSPLYYLDKLQNKHRVLVDTALNISFIILTLWDIEVLSIGENLSYFRNYSAKAIYCMCLFIVIDELENFKVPLPFVICFLNVMEKKSRLLFTRHIEQIHFKD